MICKDVETTRLFEGKVPNDEKKMEKHYGKFGTKC